VTISAWEDLECLHKACHAARTDGGLFTDTGVDERGENERQSENDCEMKTIARSRGQRTEGLVQTRLIRRKELFKEKCFEFRVKLMRGEGKYSGEESVACAIYDGDAEGCRSFLGEEFQSTEA